MEVGGEGEGRMGRRGGGGAREKGGGGEEAYLSRHWRSFRVFTILATLTHCWPWEDTALSNNCRASDSPME